MTSIISDSTSSVLTVPESECPSSPAKASPAKESSASSSMLRVKLSSIDLGYQFRTFLSNFVVGKLSSYSALYPKICVGCVVLFSCGIFAIGLLTNFTMEVNATSAWTPVGSESLKHQEWIFDAQQSGYPAKNRFESLLVHANGDNVASHEALKHVFQALEVIQNLQSFQKVCNTPTKNDNHEKDHNNANSLFGFTMVDIEMPKCRIYGVTQHWNNSMTIFEDQIHSDEDVYRTLSKEYFPNGMFVYKPFILGNVGTLYDKVIYAQGYQILFEIPEEEFTDSGGEQTYIKDVLEKDFLNTLFDIQEEWNLQGIPYVIEQFSDRSFEDEVNRSIVKDLALVPLAFGVMSLVSAFTFSNHTDKVQSRCLLGCGAVIAILLSLMTGYGIMFCIGVPFTPLTQILPFIMFGIGLDDAFIVLGAYLPRSSDHTNRIDDSPRPRISTFSTVSSISSIGTDIEDTTDVVVQNIEKTMEDIGSSIALTTLTSALAFGFGALSTIPSVTYCCHYAWITILIIFLYQITFFVALIAIDERRISANRQDCCPCCTIGASNNGRVGSGAENDDADVLAMECAIQRRWEPEHEEQWIHGREEEQETSTSHDTDSDNIHFSEKIMIHYAKQLLRPHVKKMVVLVFTAVLGICSYSASQFKQEFTFTEMLPKDSYVSTYYEATQTYFSHEKPRIGVYFRCVDQSDPEIQQQMFDYVDNLVSSLDEIDEEPAYFWLRDFHRFIKDDRFSLYASINNITTFNQQLDAFLSVPVINELYGDSIARDPNTGDIITSRTFLIMNNVDLDDVTEQINALHNQREVTAFQPINNVNNEGGGPGYCNNNIAGGSSFFTYFQRYDNWELFSVVVQELRSSTVYSVFAVMFVGVLLIPHRSAIFFLIPFMISLYIDLIGILNFVGIHLNAVSLVAMVMSVGLMVDFIVHILLRYYECAGVNSSKNGNNSRDENVIETLRTIGASVFLGGLSSFLGVLPLAGSTSAIIRTIFIAFLSLISIGLLHGLVLLPVILSYVGPVNIGCQISSSVSSTAKQHQQKQQVLLKEQGGIQK